jgi:hypothetical protein
MSQIQIEEYPDMKREEKILQFIHENPGCTKTNVIDYMEKNGSSPMTTHKILKRLTKDDKKVISKPDIKNSRIHHLYINDKNRFNKIGIKLSELEKFIEHKNAYLWNLLKNIIQLQEITEQKYNEIGDEDLWKEDEINHDEINLDKLQSIDNIIEHHYVDSITKILDVLFIKITDSNLTQKDIQTLGKRILKLRSKIYSHRWKTEWDMNFLDGQKMNIKKIENDSKREPGLQVYFEEMKIGEKLTRPLTELIESIQREFMT